MAHKKYLTEEDLKAAQRQNSKRWRNAHKEELRTRKQLERIALREIKRERGCLHCGITDSRVLEFHHRNPDEKEFHVSGGYAGANKERLAEEIAKCDVLCANCHRILEHVKKMFPMNDYAREMVRAMKMLAADPQTIFLYQNYGRVGWTLTDIAPDKKIDLPVIEDAQMGFATGMALAGFIPVSCYVRWNFLLLAANQLVNHLDKLEQMSDGGYKPKVIVRTGVGSTKPLYPGCQSDGDYTLAFRFMLTNVDVVTLNEPEDIYPAYSKALRSERSTILVEVGDAYES